MVEEEWGGIEDEFAGEEKEEEGWLSVDLLLGPAAAAEADVVEAPGTPAWLLTAILLCGADAVVK